MGEKAKKESKHGGQLREVHTSIVLSSASVLGAVGQIQIGTHFFLLMSMEYGHVLLLHLLYPQNFYPKYLLKRSCPRLFIN